MPTTRKLFMYVGIKTFLSGNSPFSVDLTMKAVAEMAL
jgi:hypothetical protein